MDTKYIITRIVDFDTFQLYWDNINSIFNDTLNATFFDSSDDAIAVVTELVAKDSVTLFKIETIYKQTPAAS